MTPAMRTDEHGWPRQPAVALRGIPWLSILAVALLLRLVGVRYGLPAGYNPDEVSIMSRALAFAKGDPNPHNFLYPTLYFYVLFAWEGLTALVAVAMGAVASFAAFQREFFLDPTRVFVAGRLLTALLGTATVAATMRLGWHLRGARAGLIAGLLLAVAPLHVLNSHYVKHDVPVTLLIVLAYLAYWRLWGEDGGSERHVAIAAAVTGLAFSTHYYAIFLAIPLAWSAARGAATKEDAIKRVALAATVSAVVFFACSPFIVAEPATAIRDIRANRQIVVDRAVGEIGYWTSAWRYMRLLTLDTTGAPTAILAAAGVLGGMLRGRSQTTWLLAFPVPFLLFIFSTYPASRYLVPLTPFIAIFAAFALDGIGGWAASRRTGGRWTVAVAAVGCAVVAGATSVRTDAFIRQTDTRTLAREFVVAHLPDGASVLIQPYSVPLEATADSLREAVTKTGK